MSYTIFLRDQARVITQIPYACEDKDLPELIRWEDRFFLRRSVTTSIPTYWEIKPLILPFVRGQPAPDQPVPADNPPPAAPVQLPLM